MQHLGDALPQHPEFYVAACVRVIEIENTSKQSHLLLVRTHQLAGRNQEAAPLAACDQCSPVPRLSQVNVRPPIAGMILSKRPTRHIGPLDRGATVLKDKGRNGG